jgi:ribosomal protein S18 acetylase RimI-like enzyme
MAHSIDVQLQPYSQNSPLLNDAIDVYKGVWQERAIARAAEWFTEFTDYQDFLGFVAFQEGNAVGVGMGARTAPGSLWYDQVAAHVGGDHPALQDAWRLAEVAVLPSYQGQGIGGRLHDALLASQHCARLVLTSKLTNTRAIAMFEQRGWEYFARQFYFEGVSYPFVIMGKDAEAH